MKRRSLWAFLTGLPLLAQTRIGEDQIRIRTITSFTQVIETPPVAPVVTLSKPLKNLPAVYKNGLRQMQGLDFTLAGQTITFKFPLDPEDSLLIEYLTL